jgi:transcriptional regulator with XRE-family HTH domain
MNKYTFGHLLKVTRLRHGLDQREFSELLDISQATYSRYEKGKTDPPLSLVMKLTEKHKFPSYLLFYPDLDEFVLNLPLDLIAFYLFENHYDYNPLRMKSTKRKNDDMLELFSGLISTIGQIKLRYNSYKLQTFIDYLVIHEYDIDKLERMINPIKNAYKIE